MYKGKVFKLCTAALIFLLGLATAHSLKLHPEESLVFLILGLFFGLIMQVRWIEVLVRDWEFYSKNYSVKIHHTHKKIKRELFSRHTRNVLPFYIIGLLALMILLFSISLMEKEYDYILVFAIGAVAGAPLGYVYFEDKPRKARVIKKQTKKHPKEKKKTKKKPKKKRAKK